jgi:predicted AlkP superfamily phosphohydrolase/phosphomutase
VKLKKINKVYSFYLLAILVPILFLILDFHVYNKNVAFDDKFSFNAKKPNAKIILLGIDGMDWKIINRLINIGSLPNIQWLKKNGSYGELTTIKYESPAIWTSIATGVIPRIHNIYKHTQSKMPGMKSYVQFPYYLGLNEYIQSYFNKVNLNLIIMSGISSDKRRVPALWNILSEKDRQIFVLNWIATFPIERIKGFIVAPQLYYYLLNKNIFANDINLYYFDSYSINSAVNTFKRSFRTSNNSDQFFSKLATDFLKKNFEYDLFMLYLNEIDGISHRYWKFMDPDKYFFVNKEEIIKYENFIYEEYIEKDRLIGNIIKELPDDVCLIICSDHGFGPAIFEYNTSGGHGNSPDGVFIAYGDIFKRANRLKNISIYDVFPTILHILGFPCPRDIPGNVIEQSFNSEIQKNIDYIDTYGKRNKSYKTNIKRLSAEEEKRLKSLGYIK